VIEGLGIEVGEVVGSTVALGVGEKVGETIGVTLSVADGDGDTSGLLVSLGIKMYAPRPAATIITTNDPMRKILVAASLSKVTFLWNNCVRFH
jgi:hypothetical protein